MNKPVDWITTVGTDGMLEMIEDRPDFWIPEEDFDVFAEWLFAFAEKRELLGSSSHLLYICRKLGFPIYEENCLMQEGK